MSSSMHTEFVLDAVDQAPYGWQHGRDGVLIHRSDRRSQCVIMRYRARPGEAGIETFGGGMGELHNAFAGAINRLYKAELIHRWSRVPGNPRVGGHGNPKQHLCRRW